MPYKPKASTKIRKNRKLAIAKASRAIPPQIYVQVRVGDLGGTRMYRAHIRVRRGVYRYLVWREEDRIREFYMGKVSKACPTSGAGRPKLQDLAGAARRRILSRVRK
jgi:hypothetical protein